MRPLPEHGRAGTALQDAYLSAPRGITPELWEALWANFDYVQAVDTRLREVMEHNKLGDGS